MRKLTSEQRKYVRRQRDAHVRRMLTLPVSSMVRKSPEKKGCVSQRWTSLTVEAAVKRVCDMHGTSTVTVAQYRKARLELDGAEYPKTETVLIHCPGLLAPSTDGRGRKS